ncbi:arylsulfatase [Paludibaculum fermentans]|uniref:arylsulfatase n=1 Tax=Paludibaculum fermentans TaxID=1473598 RepID=UPI003EBC51DA
MSTTRRSFLRTAATAAAGLGQLTAAQGERPNILLILADDMGFSDIGCYGSEIATPNLDRLAGQGVRFTQFYNCARCCPSRASLLTGLYPHQAGIGHMVDQAGPAPGYVNDLSPRSRTIAQVLKASGYQTGMAGKWHVTPVNQSRQNWPLQRGFDRYYGMIHGAADYYNPPTLTLGNETVAPGPNFYFTDAIGDYAVRFLDEFAQKPDPFFLYTAFTAPHWPLHARPEDIRKYSGRYNKGWDELRLTRHEKQLQMGLLPKRWPITARDEQSPAWRDVTDAAWQARRMEVYAAMVDRLDVNIGRIFDKLSATGRDRSTLVMFMSDNGGCAEEIQPNWTGRHIPKGTRDGRPVSIGNRATVMPGPDDTYQSYGLPWANASNTPFRLYKHWVHEGGISSPLIVRWPGHVTTAPRFDHTPAHFIDVMATCVDAARAPYPAPNGGADSAIPLEGRSLVPAGGTRAERSLYWEHEGNRALRRGAWKLVGKHPGDWELYNIDEDRTELHNLAAANPQRVREMAADWGRWAQRVGVLPWDEVSKQQTAR